MQGTVLGITTYMTPSGNMLPGVGAGGIFSGIGEIEWDGETCTGELISPDVVITAAHCLGSGTTVTFSNAVGSPVYTAVQEVANPGYTGVGVDDVALILLNSDVEPGITIYNLSTNTNSASLIGQEITLAGYGYGGVGVEQSGAGTLIAGTNTYVGQYPSAEGSALAIYFSSTGPSTEGFTCYGDSGGASFLGDVLGTSGTPTLVAIHDFISASGGTPNCSFGEGAGDENVAQYAGFIASTEAAFAAPEPGTWAMLGIGLGVVVLRMRRR